MDDEYEEEKGWEGEMEEMDVSCINNSEQLLYEPLFLLQYSLI